ncbi:MAG: patatin-like phospholipase family protein [Acidobacteriaceae bacterium]
MKRILALDGGGIRGVFSLELLLHMQKMLRRHYGREDFLLRDHFDFFAGASTGAIIAACLAWGYTVEQILELYARYGGKMFQPIPWYLPWKRYGVSRYNALPLSDMLQRIFSEDGQGKVPALLGTEKLRMPDGTLKLLLVVVRNHTTGSAWPVTNNPFAEFNDRALDDCNLDIPLYQLIRASTAAPVYFDPEVIYLGKKKPTRHVFVDGSITPYNNPAVIAALTAILPCYHLEWETGPDKIRLISLGTLRFPSGLPPEARHLWVGYNASHIPAALIQGAASEQDYLCRCLGECQYGEPVDSEVKTLVGVPLPGQRWFSYVRYNRSFRAAEVTELLREHPSLARLDAIHAIPVLRRLGERYAAEHVKLEHLLSEEELSARASQPGALS